MGSKGFEPLSGTRHLALATKLTSLTYMTFATTKDESYMFPIKLISAPFRLSRMPVINQQKCNNFG